MGMGRVRVRMGMRCLGIQVSVYFLFFVLFSCLSWWVSDVSD